MIPFEEFRIDVICQIKSSLESSFLNQGPCVFQPGLRFVDSQWFEFGFEKSAASMKSTFPANEYRSRQGGVEFAFEFVMPRSKPGMTDRGSLLVACVHEVIAFFMITCG